MITEIIEKPAKLELVRKVNYKYIKPLINLFLKKISSTSSGVNVMEDKKSLITSLIAGKKKYYAIVRDDNYHRIEIEIGLKVEVGGTWRTRKPRNYEEYNICNDLALFLVRSIYDILSLGEIKRNEE